MKIAEEEIREQFRQEAAARNLTLPFGTAEAHYYLDLHQGPLRTRQNPAEVFELVTLAKKYYDPGGGEHIALLRLVARKADLNGKKVDWYSPSYISDSRDHPEEWISLEQLLEEKGFKAGELKKNSKR